MEYVIYGLLGLVAILFGANKWGAITKKALEAKLLLSDTKVNEAKIDGKIEANKQKLEDLEKERDVKIEDSKKLSAEDFWKKKL